MKSKGMLLKIPCIALAGLIALSGHALAADNRTETINKLQESNVSSILVDKVLGYGSFYDLRLTHKTLSISQSSEKSLPFTIN